MGCQVHALEANRHRAPRQASENRLPEHWLDPVAIVQGFEMDLELSGARQHAAWQRARATHAGKHAAHVYVNGYDVSSAGNVPELYSGCEETAALCSRAHDTRCAHPVLWIASARARFCDRVHA